MKLPTETLPVVPDSGSQLCGEKMVKLERSRLEIVAELVFL